MLLEKKCHSLSGIVLNREGASCRKQAHLRYEISMHKNRINSSSGLVAYFVIKGTDEGQLWDQW